MQAKVWVALGIGSNMGDREAELQSAVVFLRGKLSSMACSSVYSSSPLGFISENFFLNAVVLGLTDLVAEELLAECLAYELSRGRRRLSNGYADRQIDIDLVFYGSRKCVSEKLTLPHPKWNERDFVFEPLREVLTRDGMEQLGSIFPAMPSPSPEANVKKVLRPLCI